jgi:hypothetical protein
MLTTRPWKVVQNEWFLARPIPLTPNVEADDSHHQGLLLCILYLHFASWCRITDAKTMLDFLQGWWWWGVKRNQYIKRFG